MAALIRRSVAALALATTVGAGDRLEGQATGHWLSAGVGVERVDRRDRRISPARYGGVVSGWRLGFERRGKSTLVDAGFEYAGGGLSAASSGGEEDVARAGLDAAVQLCLRSTLFVGVRVETRGDGTDHRYPQTPFTERFDVVVASVSPVVAWLPTRRVAGGSLQLRGSIAALSLVDREYSRSKAASAPDELSGPTTWSAGSIEATQLFREDARVSWRLGLRTTIWSHRVEEGATSVETRGLFVARVRIGGAR